MLQSVILSGLCLVVSRGQYGQSYGNDPKSQSQNRYLLDSPYNACRQPLFARSNVTATSWWHDR